MKVKFSEARLMSQFCMLVGQCISEVRGGGENIGLLNPYTANVENTVSL
jgi:hypothetical protein